MAYQQPGSDRQDFSTVRRVPGAFAQFAKRTFDSLSVDQARAVLETRPDAVATIRRSGPRPYRIFCFGGGALRGLGLRDHNLGLPGRIADAVVEQTGRGVQIDVVVDAEPTSAAALALLAGLRLRRYDVVIVYFGEHETVRPHLDQWRGAVVGLTRLLMTQTSTASGLFFYDSSRAVSIAGLAGGKSRELAAAAQLSQVTEQVCTITGRVRYHELRLTLGAQDASGRFSDGTYRDWADLVVTRMKPTFTTLEAAQEAESPRAYRNKPQDERFRQRALDALRLRRPGRDEHLDREIAAARAMYRTNIAAVTILDGDIQWMKASTEDTLRTVPRNLAICDSAIQSDELTLINDTWLDSRTRSNPVTQGEGGIRFYAGFPIHSIDGYRVGMVCILDTNPRSLRQKELEGLRDVAARVEQRLWNDLLRGAST